MTIDNSSYKVDGIPLWVLEPTDFHSAVLIYHGLKSHKGANEREMWSLAQAGFLAVGVDAIAHGERNESRDWSDPEVRYGTLQQTALEGPRVVDHLRQRFPQLRSLGALGISMGGFTLFSLIAEHPGILSAASILIASPRWLDLPTGSPLEQHSPHGWPDRYFPTALLIQNAGQDEHVRTDHARDFQQVLRPYYRQAPERLRYVEYPDSGHFMRPPDWEIAWQETLDWFHRYL